MSRIPYTVDVNEYICDVLEDIRKSMKTLDFSRLPAQIEHLQYHASRMEGALDRNWSVVNYVKERGEDSEVDDKEFREKLVEIYKKENEKGLKTYKF
jgi:hypothetical protein